MLFHDGLRITCLECSIAYRAIECDVVGIDAVRCFAGSESQMLASLLPVSLGETFLSSENRSSGFRVRFWMTSEFLSEQVEKNYSVCLGEPSR